MDAIANEAGQVRAIDDRAKQKELGRRPTLAEAEAAVRTLIRWAGDDPSREGLLDTPARVVRSYAEFFSGYTEDPNEILSRTFEEVEGYDDWIMLRDIRLESHCEHHMLPIIGVAHIAYIPKGRVIGLSKIPRIVDLFSRRLQVQERMTRQIADFLCNTIYPLGAGVVVEALHLCSMMRGVKKHDARMTTSTMVGSFRTNPATRQEFLDSISRGAEPLHF